MVIGGPDAQCLGLHLPGEDGLGILHREQILGIGGHAPRAEQPPEGKDKVIGGDSAAVRPAGVLPELEGIGAPVRRHGIAFRHTGVESAVGVLHQQALKHIGCHQNGVLVLSKLGIKGAGCAGESQLGDVDITAAAGKQPQAEHQAKEHRAQLPKPIHTHSSCF